MDLEAVKEYLDKYSSASLQMFARHRGLPPVGVKKRDMIDALAPLLFDREWIKKMGERLPSQERFALGAVQKNGGKFFPADLEEVLRQKGLAEPMWPIREVMAKGLLLYPLSAAEQSPTRLDLWGVGWQYKAHNRELWLPPEVTEVLGQLWEPEVTEEEAVLQAYPGEVTPRRIPFAQVIRDAYTLVQAIRERPLTFTRAKAIRKSDLKRLNAQFSDSDTLHENPFDPESGRLDFLLLLLTANQCVRITEEGISASDESAAFFSLPVAEQTRRLLKGWLMLLGWREWWRIPEIMIVDEQHPDLPDDNRILEARRIILEALRTPAATAGWIALDSFLAVLRQRKGDLLFSRRYVSRYSYGIASSDFENDSPIPYGGIVPTNQIDFPQYSFDKRKDWDQIEGAFIRVILQEPLRWLGLVEVGLNANGEAAAFRLTPEGAAALGLEAPLPEEPAEAPRGLIVQPNFEMVFLPDVAGFGAAIELDRFADRESVDQAILFRLTRESIYRGLGAGITDAQMIDRLETLSQAPLPQNVRHSLEEWAGKFHGLRLHRAVTVVTADTAAELDAALRAHDTRQAVRLSPAAARVPAHFAALSGRRKRDLLRWCDYNALPVKVLRAEKGRRLVVPEKHLTPYLHYLLAGFTVPGEETGVFQLDAARLRASLRGGTCLAEIEQFLEGAATGPLPEDLRLTLRAWGGAYRNVATARAVVFCAPADLLDLLLADSPLRDHILARPAPGLLLVDEVQAEALRAALAEFGLTPGEDPAAVQAAAASTADTAAGEMVRILPPKGLRQILEQAIAEKRGAVLAYLGYNSSRVRPMRVRPTEIMMRGSQYTLIATDEAGKERYFESREIQGIRLAERDEGGVESD